MMGRKIKRTINSPNQISITNKMENSNLRIHKNPDANHLTTIFPEEVWLMILVDKVGTDSINGNASLINCSMASVYFRKLLDSRRKFFLFPKVLDCLTTWLENEEIKLDRKYHSSNSDESDFANKGPTSNSVFKLTDVLKCREICSAWNKSFVDLYQNPNPYTAMMQDRYKLPRNLGCVEISMCENNIELSNIDKYPPVFLEHFKISHGGGKLSRKVNPFPGRHILFTDLYVSHSGSMGEEHENLRKGMSTILEKYGDNWWHCNLELVDLTVNNRLDFYWQFKQWLTLMPNLKTLQISCSHLFKSEQMSNTDEIFSEIQEDINLNPLPTLKSLQFLQVTGLAPVYFNELMKRNGRTITQLEITRQIDPENESDYEIYSETQYLPKLNEISIDFNSVKQFEQMEKSVVAAEWKLKKLYFLYDEDSEFLKWSRVFQMISDKWFGSMKNLVLQMPVAFSNEEKYSVLEASLSSSILQLPSLKRIKLIVKNPCSLDFLLPSSNALKCIEIIGDYNVDEERKRRYYKILERQQVVKFLGFENSEEQFTSNILEKFPEANFLKIVTPLNTDKKHWYRVCVYDSGEISSKDGFGYSSKN